MSSRTTRTHEPNNEEKIDDKNQKMKRRIRQFSKAVDNIRNFVDPDTNIEVQRRLMRGLADQLDIVRQRQDGIEGKVNLILALLTAQSRQQTQVNEEEQEQDAEEVVEE